MAMAMMEIRPMGMRVHQRLVPMGVGVPLFRVHAGMDMGVMPVVMGMEMGMFHFLMSVPMRMLIPEHQGKAKDQESRREAVYSRERLPKQGPRQDQSEERRGRENHLAANGPQALGRRDIENDTGPIRQGAHGQGHAYGICRSLEIAEE